MSGLYPKTTVVSFLIVVIALFMTFGCSNSSSGGGGTNDASFYVAGYIHPTTFPVTTSKSSALGGTGPTVTSCQYYAVVHVNSDNNGTAGSAYSDAMVTVNGFNIPYYSAGPYYNATLPGTYSVGSTFAVVISHSGMDTISETLTVPASTLPNTYTITPAPNAGVVQPYALSPGSAWPRFGTFAALLYDGSGTPVYQNYYYETSLTGITGYTFTTSNLTYGGSTFAPNIKFASWTEDKIDPPGYGMSGSSPTRLRVFATDGMLIGGTF